MPSMEELFPEYCPLTEDKAKELWQSCIFVFDTNVILNLYRYQSDTVDQFFLICEEIADRVWMPYQVCKEFMKNRPSVMIEQVTSLDKYIDTITNIKKKFESEFKLKHHSAIDIAHILSTLEHGIDEAIDYINKSKTNLNGSIHDFLSGDSLIQRLNNLFKDKINTDIGDESAAIKQVLQRYKDKIPPGYEDAKGKDEISSCGDGLIWLEILKKAKDENRSVVFISDDDKDDWVWRVQGKRLWCRPELMNEFSKHTGGGIFYSYTMTRFFEFCKKIINIQIKPSSIDDVKRIYSEQVLPEEVNIFFNDLIEIIRKSFEDSLSNEDVKNVLSIIDELKKNLLPPDFVSEQTLQRKMSDLLLFLSSHSSANKISNESMRCFYLDLSDLFKKHNKLKYYGSHK